MTSDTRGATSPISYALTIAMTTILITGLVVAATGHVSDQRGRTAQTQMDVVAQQVAGSLEGADRLVRADEDGDPDVLALERELPRQIQTTGYTAEVTANTDQAPSTQGRVNVSSPISDRTVSVVYHSDTQVAEGSVQGGQITIRYDSNELEVAQ